MQGLLTTQYLDQWKVRNLEYSHFQSSSPHVINNTDNMNEESGTNTGDINDSRQTNSTDMSSATPFTSVENGNTSSSSFSKQSNDTQETMGVPQETIPKRIVRTGRVNCRWLYNQLQAARGMILIDTRSRTDYNHDSIPTAISIPPPSSNSSCTSVEQAMTHMLDEQRLLFSTKKRKLRDVVLYGDILKRSCTMEMSWMLQLEHLLVQEGLVTNVQILMDGFQTFQYRYPFFTREKHTIENITRTNLKRTPKNGRPHNVNYPNEILDGFLFLGNMWHAQSQQVIQHLGITHIVNATLDMGNVFEEQGILYHEIKIKDKVEIDISPYFDSTFAFIESAKRTTHGRVLVHCTQGISRSATLVIMYLMRTHHWSLVTAVNYALMNRGVVFPNIGFLKALMIEEYRLYGGNSLVEEEMDLLLQQQVPDRPIPLQIQEKEQTTEYCTLCCTGFSLLEWKRRCHYCYKDFCNKCTSTKLIIPEKLDASTSDKAYRVCNCCISRLWNIKIPRPRLTLRNQKLKMIHVNSLSTFGTPVCISYYEGTEECILLDVIKIRFDVQKTQIIDMSTENGEPFDSITSLPTDSTVFVSIGKAGNVLKRE